MSYFSIDSIGASTTNEASLRRKQELEGNPTQQVAYAGIPDIGSLLNGSHNPTQSTASGIRA